jgi:FkbM family methyltransferase
MAEPTLVEQPELNRAPTARQRLATATILIARRVFANTPIERLRVTAWLRGLVFRYGYGNRELSVTILGVTLELPADDLSMVPSLVGGYHERLELAIYERLARGSSLIADVGGNVGLYACVGAASMPSGKVVTFEPAPANLTFLQLNVTRNGLASKVEIVAKAVSDSPGVAKLYLSNGIGNHSLAATSAGSARHIEVPVTTIDSHFAGQHLDIIKIDVEGFDGHVLKGADQTLRMQRPAVFVELLTDRLDNSGLTPEAFVELLSGVHDHLFLADEIRGTVTPIDRAGLLALAGRTVHANLIAVSRPDHLAVVREFALEDQPRIAGVTNPPRT